MQQGERDSMSEGVGGRAGTAVNAPPREIEGDVHSAMQLLLQWSPDSMNTLVINFEVNEGWLWV